MKDRLSTILETIEKKHLLKRIIILCICLFISALIFNFFQKASHLVTGGTSGVAIITEYLFELEPSMVILIQSCFFLLLSLIFLGLEATTGALIVTFVYPFFVQLTSSWPNFMSIDTTDMLLISIFIGVVSGITNGLTYKNGFNNGGFSVISQILFKYQKIAISTTSFIINFTIVLLGGFFFGWKMVMYAAIILYINSVVMDRVLIGVSKNKSIYIMTTKNKEINEFITEKLHHGTTEFDVEGGLKFKKRKVLMTVIPTKDYFKLKEGVKIIDNNCFFIVTDSYQASGGK